MTRRIYALDPQGNRLFEVLGHGCYTDDDYKAYADMGKALGSGFDFDPPLDQPTA